MTFLRTLKKQFKQRLTNILMFSQPDWYFENGLLVYTAAYHVKRGFCCGSGCRHCPYEPRHVEGSTKVRL